MNKDNEFSLELTEKTAAMVEELAQKTERTQEQVIEFILQEYLMNQLQGIEKKAAKTGTPLHDLLNERFERLLEFMLQPYTGKSLN